MKFSILILLLISAVLLFLPTINYQLPTVSAQTACLTQSPNPRVMGGLITTPSFSGMNNFGNDTGICVTDPKAAFAPYNIPTYEDLKSMYFDQSKSTRKSTRSGDTNQGHITGLVQASDTDRLIYVNGSLTISGGGFLNGKPTIPIVIFVQNDLTINNNLNFAYNSPNGGLVFVVGGDVSIDEGITQINAVIISAGTIYTADSDCSTSSVEVGDNTNALTINGSLISLDPGSIVFCRTLTDNSSPAEIISHQPKYLVILRNLFADTLQKWSEIQ